MRRLNVKLALWLVGITLVSVVGVHLLHGYQLDRNAVFLRLQAEKAKENGEVKEAIKQYNQYLKYRGDDREGYRELAGLVVIAAKEPDATPRDRFQAFTILQEAIRRHPDLSEVRRSLVEYSIMIRRFTDALEHIEYLNGQGEKDPGLDLKAAECYLQSGEEDNAMKKLYDVLGWDQATAQFRPEPGPGAKEVKAFEMLARILRRRNDPKRADEAMAKMVEWNPDSAKAHLARADYLASSAAQSSGTRAEQEAAFKELLAQAKTEMARAFELAPEDVDVLLMVSAFAMGDSEFEKAQDALDQALKAAPTRADVYVRLAQLANMQKNPKLAAEHLDNGVKHAPDVHILLPMLVELRLQLKELDLARAGCKAMYERVVFRPEVVRYLEARISLAEGDFWRAAREFEAVRPALARTGGEAAAVQADLALGRCYEVLSQPDRQLEALRRVLRASPADLNARLGETTALQALGRHDEVGNNLELLAANVEQFPMIRPILLQMLITDRMQKPADKRGWKEVDRIAGLILQDPTRSDLDNTLLKADLELLRDRLDEAQTMLLNLSKEYPKNPQVWLGLSKILQRRGQTSNKDSAPNVAKLLDRAEQEAGDVVSLRVERARLIARQRGTDALANMAKLEQNVDKFSQPERTSLMLQLGAAYLQLGSFENTARCWKYAIEHDPNNATTRQLLFELAIDNKDKDLMQQIVKEFHDSKNWGPQSTQYQYCAATEKLWPINLRASQTSGAVALSAEERGIVAEARKLIDEALAVRGEWSVLWRVRAEIDQLDGNVSGAINDYKQALEFTRSGQSVIARRLVQLLYKSNRFAEADEALKYLGDVRSDDPLYKMAARIKFEQGEAQQALEMAAKEVKAEPKNTGNLIWYGNLLEQVSRLDEAEASYRQATKVSPDLAGAWAMLVRVLVINRKMDKAAEAVREANKSLSKNELAMARLYELVSDNEQAETHYKAAAAERADDLTTARQIVEFYFRTARAGDPNGDVNRPLPVNETRGKILDRMKLATPYLEQIVKKTSQSTSDSDVNLLAWARRCQAEIVAAPGDYEHIRQAAELIEQNARNGKLGVEDNRALITLFANRPDAHSRGKSARLLEELEKQRPLTPAEQFSLGQLYERLGKWGRGKELIVRALAIQGNDPAALIKFVNLLTAHDEKEDAARWLDKLDEVLSKAPLTVADQYRSKAGELRARLLAKTGQAQQAVAVLDSVIPRPLAAGQLPRLEHNAVILEQLEQYDAAEKLLDEYVSQDPRGTIAKAAYIGRRGDINKAFGLLEEARKNQPVTAILPSALDALRRHPEKATPQHFRTLEEWSKSGLQNEKDVTQIKLLQAELFDMQARYNDVIQIYRELLASKDATPLQVAIVKNNLAFILALTKEPRNVAEALKLTEEAMRVMGPISDLLDTRGLAFLAQGKVEQAVGDFSSASADNPPSAAKFFHLAQAQKQANNVEAARDALAQAQQIGVDLNKFSPAEKKSYLQLVDELK